MVRRAGSSVPGGAMVAIFPPTTPTSAGATLDGVTAVAPTIARSSIGSIAVNVYDVIERDAECGGGGRA